MFVYERVVASNPIIMHYITITRNNNIAIAQTVMNEW